MYLSHVFTPLSSVRGSLLSCTVIRGSGLRELCGVQTAKGAAVWIEGVAGAGCTAMMVCHQLLCSQAVSALCRACATAGCAVNPWAVLCCPRRQDGYPRGRRGRHCWELKALMSDAVSSVHLSLDNHSVRINIP